MEERAKTQNPRPNLQSVPRQIRKEVKANLYKHFQAQCKMPLQATSLQTSVAISEVIKKVLESLNCIAIEIVNDDGNTEIRILTIDIDSKPIRTKPDAISL